MHVYYVKQCKICLFSNPGIGKVFLYSKLPTYGTHTQDEVPGAGLSGRCTTQGHETRIVQNIVMPGILINIWWKKGCLYEDAIYILFSTYKYTGYEKILYSSGFVLLCR